MHPVLVVSQPVVVLILPKLTPPSQHPHVHQVQVVPVRVVVVFVGQTARSNPSFLFVVHSSSNSFTF